MKKIIFCFFICFSLSFFAQESTFKKSKIIDSISVDKNNKETYALYLPSQYNPSELSPIIFIFEPVGRGKVGIYPFIKTAEKYSYILVCSNDSKNGPYTTNFDITNRLFNSVFSRFNINQKRIYTSGFSGGARLAATIAVLTKQVQGVLTCGAGFSTSKEHLPLTERFSYASIVGNLDMNFIEANNTKAWLNKLNISNELFVYEINHKWPSQEQVLIAFDWLQLEAYKKGVIPKNDTIIQQIYNQNYEHALKLEKENKILLAYNNYQSLFKNFSRYYIIDSLKTKLKNLSKSKSYRKEKQELINNFKEESTYTTLFLNRFKKDLNTRHFKLKWWDSEMAKLKKRLQDASPSKKRMLNRLLYKIYALSIETVGQNASTQNLNVAAFCYDICLLIYPKYNFLYFRQITNFISKNNTNKALDYLDKLLKSGYKNKEFILNYKPFNRLKNTERFKQLMKD